MTVLDRLASALSRGDEAPNQALAQEIAAAGDAEAVRELVAHLSDSNKEIASDCIKVLYEIGALKPELIAAYADDFIKLLHSRNNRLVWGAMTALGSIAPLRAADIFRQIDVITEATQHGSVITQDWGVRVLAAVAAQDAAYAARIFPFLLTFLRRCPPKDLPRHAESVLDGGAVNAGNRDELLTVLEGRKGALAAQNKRIEAVIRRIKAL
jgi:HEAT repeat protein